MAFKLRRYYGRIVKFFLPAFQIFVAKMKFKTLLLCLMKYIEESNVIHRSEFDSLKLQGDKVLQDLDQGSISSTYLRAAFTPLYARSSQKRKNSVKLSVSFYAFGIYGRKSCSLKRWWNWHLLCAFVRFGHGISHLHDELRICHLLQQSLVFVRLRCLLALC